MDYNAAGKRCVEHRHLVALRVHVRNDFYSQKEFVLTGKI